MAKAGLCKIDAEIERETAFIHKTRPICVALKQSGVKVWLKGTREGYVVPYDELFRDAQQGSVKIPARHVSDAKLAKIAQKRLDTQRPTGAESPTLIGCVGHDCAVCQARAEA